MLINITFTCAQNRPRNYDKAAKRSTKLFSIGTSLKIIGRIIGFKSKIIIIVYFENVAFFYAMLGLDVCPRVDNQTSATLYKIELDHQVEKSPSASYPPMDIGASFWW